MKKGKKRLLFLLLIPISLLIVALVDYNYWIAEYIFARIVYKYLSQPISNIIGLIPISFMEVSILLIILLFIFLIIYLLKLAFIDENVRKEKSINLIINVSSSFSILLFMFVIFAGTNYYRYPFAEINSITVEDSTVDELYQLNIYLVKQAYETREQLELQTEHINEDGVFEFSDIHWRELTSKAEKAFENLSIDHPVLSGNYGKPKPVIASQFMSRMEITGIFWPFTLEANINAHAPDHTIPSTMAHEMAHQRGFMREDEANYIAYLACISSDSLVFKYSGLMLALNSAGNALYNEDPLLYAQTRELYNEGMVVDLRHKSNYWNQYKDTAISIVSNKMNDTYLKANNQKDGVKSYGRMVDLLLAGFKDEYYL